MSAYEARMIAGMAQSFAAVMRAAGPPRPPRDRLAELRDLYVNEKISLISFEIELAHMPGGIPE